jgi:hypothetical protein
VFEGRAAIGYDHGYDAEVFYPGLTLNPTYVEGFVQGCLEQMGFDYQRTKPSSGSCEKTKERGEWCYRHYILGARSSGRPADYPPC